MVFHELRRDSRVTTGNSGITLLAYEMSEIVWEFEHYLALPFFEIGMKTDLFHTCGHC